MSRVEIGRKYEDATGRELVVAEYLPGAIDGREVIGTLTTLKGEDRSYATDLPTFRRTWLERQPPTPRDQMRLA